MMRVAAQVKASPSPTATTTHLTDGKQNDFRGHKQGGTCNVLAFSCEGLRQFDYSKLMQTHRSNKAKPERSESAATACYEYDLKKKRLEYKKPATRPTYFSSRKHQHPES